MRVKARGIKKRTRMRIKVRPTSTTRDYKIRLKKKRHGNWRFFVTVRTTGPRDIVKVNLPRGRYLAVAPAQHGFDRETSRVVRIRR